MPTLMVDRAYVEELVEKDLRVNGNLTPKDAMAVSVASLSLGYDELKYNHMKNLYDQGKLNIRLVGDEYEVTLPD